MQAEYIAGKLVKECNINIMKIQHAILVHAEK